MSAWPRWQIDDTAALPRYVQMDVVRRLLPAELVTRLPGTGRFPRLDRARAAYEVLADAGIRYEHEPATSRQREQEIRPPDHVLHRPREGTCVDVALVYAGMCLDAGLHPLIALCEASTAGGPGHALVIVWLGGDWRGDGPALDYPLREQLDGEIRQKVRGDLLEFLDQPGAFVAIDIKEATEQTSWADAVIAGARILLNADERWTWSAVVDVGLAYSRADAFKMPYWPQRDVLSVPYHAPDLQAGPLTGLQARRRRNEFEALDELDVLEHWCTAPDPANPVRLAIVYGSGGAGKTHLAAELADGLAARGWEAGFLNIPVPAKDLRWLAGLPKPLLVVVDYAEAKQQVVLKLMRELSSRVQPACVILTARAVGDWWTDELAADLVSTGVRHAFIDIRLPDRHPKPHRVFRRALRAFGMNPLDAETVDPPEGRWTTLDLVMQAWLRAHGITDLPSSRTKLYDEVLSFELRYWRKTAKVRGLKRPPRTVLRSAGAVLSLLAPTEDRVAATLTAVAALDSDRVDAERLAELLKHLLPPEDGTFAIRPDVVADHLMLAELDKPQQPKGAESEALLNRALKVADDDERFNAVVALTRADANNSEKAGRFAQDALRHRPDLWRPALTVASAVGGPFAAALTSLARAEGTPLPLAEIDQRIPLGHIELRPLALIAAEGSMPQAPPAGADKEVLGHYANRLANLARRLSDSGDWAAALERAREAVAIYGALTADRDAADSASYLPDLAGSLDNLGAQLSKAGRRAEAVPPTQEAVTIFRGLAEADPAAHLPQLAALLDNLGIRLGEAGRLAEALPPTKVAITIRRELARANPAYLPELATTLHNLGIRLAELGRHAEALPPTEGAVTIRRGLAEAYPAAYLPDLAWSLASLASRLSEAGRPGEALPPVEGAVTIFRGLAESNPSAHLHDLAGSLHNLGLRLAGVGRLAEALRATEEAVTIFRGLAEANPGAHLPNLAGSLHNLGIWLDEAGRRAEALRATEEAVTIYREVAEADPAAYLPNLAMSLQRLSVELAGETGRRSDGLPASEEAVTIFRRLVEVERAVYLPNLARSLQKLGIELAAAGRRVEALRVAEEAVTSYRELVEADRASRLPDLAMSLLQLGNELATAGRRAESLRVTKEAVTYYRGLARKDPAVYVPPLDAALHHICVVLSEMDAGGAEASEQYELAVAAVSPGPGAELLVRRAGWHLAAGRNEGARRDLARARDLAEAEPDSDRATRARLAVRTFLLTLDDGQLDAFDPGGTEGWPTAELSDDVASVLNTWLAASDWPGRESVLLNDTVHRPDFREQFQLARFLYPGAKALESLRDVLDDIGAHGSETVLARYRAAHEHLTLLREWINAPTWAASLQFALDHRELRLSDDDTVALLFGDGSDPVSTRHAAIATLIRAMPLPEVYDAVTDPQHAADLAMKRLEHGDVHTARLLATACPDLEQDPFAGRFVVAAWLVLSGTDGAAAVIAEAALAGTNVQLKAGALRLQKLAAARPGDSNAILDLAEAFDHACLLRAWIDTQSWDESLAFAREHPGLLADERTVTWLRAVDATPERVRHAAIAALSTIMPLNAVYEAVVDPVHAADLALERLEDGDATTSALLVAASPRLDEASFSGGLLAAVWLVLSGADESDPVAVLCEAARSATKEERKAGVEHLTRIANASPAHATHIRRLAATLRGDSKSPPSEWTL